MNKQTIPPLTDEDWERLEKIAGYADTISLVIRYLVDLAGSKEK